MSCDAVFRAVIHTFNVEISSDVDIWPLRAFRVRNRVRVPGYHGNSLRHEKSRLDPSSASGLARQRIKVASGSEWTH